jgi:hypothetical protein
MPRHTPNTQQASISTGPLDRQIIDELRDEYGLSFNAAVRYALRLAWTQRGADGREKMRRRKETDAWLAETVAGLRPGGR